MISQDLYGAAAISVPVLTALRIGEFAGQARIADRMLAPLLFLGRPVRSEVVFSDSTDAGGLPNCCTQSSQVDKSFTPSGSEKSRVAFSRFKYSCMAGESRLNSDLPNDLKNPFSIPISICSGNIQ